MLYFLIKYHRKYHNSFKCILCTNSLVTRYQTLPLSGALTLFILLSSVYVGSIIVFHIYSCSRKKKVITNKSIVLQLQHLYKYQTTSERTGSTLEPVVLGKECRLDAFQLLLPPMYASTPCTSVSMEYGGKGTKYTSIKELIIEDVDATPPPPPAAAARMDH